MRAKDSILNDCNPSLTIIFLATLSS